MIEREERLNLEVIDTIIINLHEEIQSDSSSEEGSMPGLQEGAREDFSSNDDKNSCDEDEIYDNGEPWGYKALTLSQIIGEKSGGTFPINIPTLYAFSWHRYAKICKNPKVKTPKSNIYQTKK